MSETVPMPSLRISRPPVLPELLSVRRLCLTTTTAELPLLATPPVLPAVFAFTAVFSRVTCLPPEVSIPAVPGGGGMTTHGGVSHGGDAGAVNAVAVGVSAGDGEVVEGEVVTGVDVDDAELFDGGGGV